MIGIQDKNHYVITNLSGDWSSDRNAAHNFPSVEDATTFIYEVLIPANDDDIPDVEVFISIWEIIEQENS